MEEKIVEAKQNNMDKKDYTSDCKYNVENLEKNINFLEKIKHVLLEYKTSEWVSENIQKNIDEIIKMIDSDLQTIKEKYSDRYPEGVYSLYTDYAQYKKGTLIKRIIDKDCLKEISKHDYSICDKCIFGKVPCLGINSYYGCYRRKASNMFSERNESRKNGELVREGYFVLYDENENK